MPTTTLSEEEKEQTYEAYRDSLVQHAVDCTSKEDVLGYFTANELAKYLYKVYGLRVNNKDEEY